MAVYDPQNKGIKTSLPGEIYQVKLLLHVLWRSIKLRCEFQIETEVKEAEKFDDLIFTYINGEERRKLYLQAKHLHGSADKITYKELLSPHIDNARFKLVKYFVSFWKIKQRKIVGEKTERLILCTNVSLNSNEGEEDIVKVKKHAGDEDENALIFEKQDNGDDDFFCSGTDNEFKIYKLSQINSEFKELFKNSIKLPALAEEIADSVFKVNKNYTNEIELDFKSYWVSCFYHILIKEKIIVEEDVIEFSGKLFNDLPEIEKPKNMPKNEKPNDSPENGKTKPKIEKLNSYKDLQSFQNILKEKHKFEELKNIKLNPKLKRNFNQKNFKKAERIAEETELDQLATELLNGNEIETDDSPHILILLKQILRIKKQSVFSSDFVNTSFFGSKVVEACNILINSLPKTILNGLQNEEFIFNQEFNEALNEDDLIEDIKIASSDSKLRCFSSSEADSDRSCSHSSSEEDEEEGIYSFEEDENSEEEEIPVNENVFDLAEKLAYYCVHKDDPTIIKENIDFLKGVIKETSFNKFKFTNDFILDLDTSKSKFRQRFLSFYARILLASRLNIEISNKIGTSLVCDDKATEYFIFNSSLLDSLKRFTKEYVNDEDDLKKLDSIFDILEFSKVYLDKCKIKLCNNIHTEKIKWIENFKEIIHRNENSNNEKEQKRYSKQRFSFLNKKKEVKEVAKELAKKFANKENLTAEPIFLRNCDLLKAVLQFIENDDVRISSECLRNDKFYEFREYFFTFYALEKLKCKTIKFKQNFNESAMQKFANFFIQKFNALKKNDRGVIQFDRKMFEKKDTNGLIESLNGFIFVPTHEKNKYCFAQSFFEDEQLQPEHAELFRTKLKKKLSETEFENLRNYQIDIDYYPVMCESSDIDDYIDEFLEHFRIIKTPNEEMLTEILTKEMWKKMKLLDAEISSNALFIKILNWAKSQEGQPLTSEIAKEFLNETAANIATLRTMGCNSLYCGELKNCQISFKNDFLRLQEFLLDDSPPPTENSRTNFERQILYVESNETFLTAVKIQQTLENIEIFSDNFLINKFSSFLIIKDFVISSFESKVNLLIIIDTDGSTKFVEFMKDVIATMQKNPEKKVIIVATKESCKTAFEKCKMSSCTFIDDNNSINDLSDDSQAMILKKEVELQGKQICLNKILCEKKAYKLIDTKTLMKLIKNEKLEIGESLKMPQEHEKHQYIKRKIGVFEIDEELFHIWSSFKGDDNFLFLIEGNKSETKSFLLNHNVEIEKIITVDEYLLWDHPWYSNITFAKFAARKIEMEQNSEKIFILIESHDFVHKKEFITVVNIFRGEMDSKEMHWLKIVNERLYWICSTTLHEYSPPLNIFKYVKRENVSEETFLEFFNDDQCLLIADIAGKGKSSLLSSLIRNSKDESFKWIVRINLNQYSQFLSGQKGLDSEDDDLNLNFDNFQQDYGKVILMALYSNECSDDSNVSFENRIFQHLFKNGKILIIFDGFDELNDDYRENVILLIFSLMHDTRNKLWVTTRTQFQDKLEEVMEIKAHEIEPFSWADQITYLTEFFNNSIKLHFKQKYRHLIEKYAIKLLANFCNIVGYEESGITETPMQLQMLATIFQENPDKSIPLTWQGCLNYIASEIRNSYPKDPEFGDKINNLFILYESFVKRKLFTFLNGKKVVDFSKYGAKRVGNAYYLDIHGIHEILGLLDMHQENHDFQFPTKKEIQEAKSREDIEYIGIITTYRGANVFEFKHSTYAEYFGACYVMKKIISFPSEMLTIIESLLAGDVMVFKYSIYYLLTTKIDRDQLEHSLNGTTILNYVAGKGLIECLCYFLSFEDFQQKDKEGNNVLSAAIQNEQLDSVVQILLFVHNLLHKENTISKMFYLCAYVNASNNNYNEKNGEKSRALICSIMDTFKLIDKKSIKPRNYKDIDVKSDLSKWAFSIRAPENIMPWHKKIRQSPFIIPYFIRYASYETLEYFNSYAYFKIFHYGKSIADDDLHVCDYICLREDLTDDEKIGIFMASCYESGKALEDIQVIRHILIVALRNENFILFSLLFIQFIYYFEERCGSKKAFITTIWKCLEYACKINSVESIFCTMSIYIFICKDKDCHDKALNVALSANISLSSLKYVYQRKLLFPETFEDGELQEYLGNSPSDEEFIQNIIKYSTEKKSKRNKIWKFISRNVETPETLSNKITASNNLIKRLKKVIKEYNEHDEHRVWLHQAVKRRDLIVANFHFEQNYNSTEKDDKGKIPFDYICENDCEDINISIQLARYYESIYGNDDSKNEHIIPKNIFDNDVFYKAVSTKNIIWLKKLIKDKIEENDKRIMASLFFAVQNDDIEMAKVLLRRGINYNDKWLLDSPANNCTKMLNVVNSLFYFMHNRKYDILKYCIENFAKNIQEFDICLLINIKDYYGSSLSDYAQRYGTYELAKYFIENGAIIKRECFVTQEQMLNGKTKNLLNMIYEIFESVASRKCDSKSIINYIQQNNLVNIITKVRLWKIENDNEIIEEDKKIETMGGTLLHYAVIADDMTIVNWLADQNVDPLANDSYSQTALNLTNEPLCSLFIKSLLSKRLIRRSRRL